MDVRDSIAEQFIAALESPPKWVKKAPCAQYVQSCDDLSGISPVCADCPVFEQCYDFACSTVSKQCATPTAVYAGYTVSELKKRRDG